MHEVRTFLAIAARHLCHPVRSKLAIENDGHALPEPKRSSSTFTTFDCLACDAVYFRGELPRESDLFETCVRDFSWASLGPVGYGEVAHVLIPRHFTEEIYIGEGNNARYFNGWMHEQDIDGLSALLNDVGVKHHLNAQVLELKRF